MNLTLRFREDWLILLGISGDAELILRIWGAKEKYFPGAEEFSFRDLRSMHYFQGAREHRPRPLIITSAYPLTTDRQTVVS